MYQVCPNLIEGLRRFFLIFIFCWKVGMLAWTKSAWSVMAIPCLKATFWIYEHLFELKPVHWYSKTSSFKTLLVVVWLCNLDSAFIFHKCLRTLMNTLKLWFKSNLKILLRSIFRDETCRCDFFEGPLSGTRKFISRQFISIHLLHFTSMAE